MRRAPPTLEPKDGTVAVDVNATGQVVGSAREFLTVRSHPLVWKDGQPTVLATLSGQTGAASAINDAGQIVGGAIDRRVQSAASRPLGRRPSHRPRDPWRRPGRRHDINEAGQIVGAAETADNQFHAFLWDRGQMIDLNVHGGLDAAVPSAAHGVNDRGQIAGEFQPPGSGLHAAVWDGDRLIDLGTRGGVYGVARDIDNAGRVSAKRK